jgi:hypothetical protein
MVIEAFADDLMQSNRQQMLFYNHELASDNSAGIQMLRCFLLLGLLALNQQAGQQRAD